MMLHDYPRFNKIAVSGNEIIDFNPPAGINELLAFTGIQVVNPEILHRLSADKYACIIAHYRFLLEAGRRISCRIDNHINWTDMGTVDDYLALHEALLQGTMPRWTELNYKGASPILVDEESRCGVNSRFQQWVCIGKACIGDDVKLKRCVVWDGAFVPNGSRISDSIIVSARGCLEGVDKRGCGSDSAAGTC